MIDKKIELYYDNGDPRFTTVSTTVTNQVTSAIGATRILITSAVQNHLVALGPNANSTVTTNCIFMPVGSSMMFNVGTNWKVAVKTVSTTGHISIVKMD
jgi:hypothetical protein